MDENECNALSRREVVGGVGISMAAAGAGPTFAQEMDQPSTSTHDSELTMEDPRSKYPKPPFRKQTQPWPGLARDMDPRPDHGEASYRESGRLSGRKAPITGGDSGWDGLPRSLTRAKGRTLRSTTFLLKSPTPGK